MKLAVLCGLAVVGTTSCDSPFYCDGPFLRAIQLKQVLGDGKEIVDRATKRPAKAVLGAFNRLNKPTKHALRAFVEANFHKPGYEVEKVALPNFNTKPVFLKNVQDKVFRGFAQQIHARWGSLVRRANLAKLCDGCVSSLLPTSHNFIVPGGRFREFYYWDSYFAMEGLNQGGLSAVSRDTILNLLDFVEQYGFVPNGARVYFLNRSQPPLLTQMVKRYVAASRDTAFVATHLRTLDKEYRYWVKHHGVQVPCPRGEKKCFLTRYKVNNKLPRPESYREDIETAEGLSPKAKKKLYAELAAGAESGWDFSSRWVPESENNRTLLASQETTLRGIRTSEIVPVDLNAIMYANEKAMYTFHKSLLKKSPRSRYHRAKAALYKQAYARRAKIMAHVLWDTGTHSFYDYNIRSKQLRREFFPSNLWPFWAGAVHRSIAKPRSIVGAFAHVKRIRSTYPGGSPASETKGSLLQWDYPNMWAPLEYMIVEGGLRATTMLKRLKQPKAAEKVEAITRGVAKTYVDTTFCAWYNSGGRVGKLLPRKDGVARKSSGDMYEKYNVTRVGGVGGGGEYTIQTGFGWTNGVLLHFLATVGRSFSAPGDPARYCNRK